MAMKVYVNARFLTQNMTGVQRFALEICQELLKLRHDLVFLVPNVENIAILERSFPVQVVGKKNGFYWEQIELPKFLKKQGNHLLINLCNRAPIFYKNNIIVLHDVIFKRYPKTVSLGFGLFYKFMVPNLIKRAKKILTVSQFSKQEILYFYPKYHRDIKVIYNAVDKKFRPHYDNHHNELYLLAVSSDFSHKNFESLVKAFLLLNHPTLKLKIVGNKGSIAIQYQNEKNINFLGRVSDEQLIELYQNAYAFVFPSLYEGFGIPPLEAQACGCPVISSNLSVMPEVLGDSVIYFNPKDVNDIKEKINLLLQDKQLYKGLVTKGLQNVARFSWADSAQILNDTINQLMIQE